MGHEPKPITKEGNMKMEKIQSQNIRVQCKEKKSGIMGDFLVNNKGECISPIFNDLVKLFDWAKQNGVKTVCFF